MFVFKAAVVGAGTMGGQIAQTIASAGIPVVLKDVDDDLVEAGLTEARKVTENQVGKLVERGKLDEDAAGAQVSEVLDRIHGTTAYDGFGDVDFVIEAVPERMEVKRAVFADLDAVTPGHAILASNTSSLSITEIGEATSRPDKVCGFHYFYPASVMRLVEIVEGDDTEAETLTTAVAFAQAIRKMPITCAEVPGFVVNRILNSALSEVWRMQEEQGLSIKQIDEAVTGSKTAPMGPFQLADLLGLDTILHVAEYLDASYPGRMYVHEGLRRLVADGKLGAKTGGEGFYADGTAERARRRRSRPAGARRPLQPQGARRGLPARRGGRGLHQGRRPRDDDRRRPDAAAVRPRRRDRPRRRRRAPRDRRGGVGRALRAAAAAAPPGPPGPPRAEGRAGRLRRTSVPTPRASSRARRSRSRRAATSRSPGSTARR